MGTIFNMQKFCLHDGDGIRTNVFFKGCPLRCLWCHNPEGLSIGKNLSFMSKKCTACGRCLEVCKGRTVSDGVLIIDRSKCDACGKCVEACLNDANELIGKEVTAKEVFDEVLKDKIFYDTSGGGMTLSGGEPSMQQEFALELLNMAHDAGISSAIESCGIGKREFYAEAAKLGAVFLYDLKCMDPEKHKKLTGVENNRIIDNLLYLFSVNADVILRLPMVPGYNDTKEDIANMARFLKAHDGKYRYAEIMPYHTLGTGKAKQLGETDPFTLRQADENDIEYWCNEFKNNGIIVRVSK